MAQQLSREIEITQGRGIFTLAAFKLGGQTERPRTSISRSQGSTPGRSMISLRQCTCAGS